MIPRFGAWTYRRQHETTEEQSKNMTTKAEALDRLIDAIAGEDVPMTSQTVAGRIDTLADGIADGTIPIGGGGSGTSVVELNLTYATATGTAQITNATALCDALDAIHSDPKNAFKYALVVNGISEVTGDVINVNLGIGFYVKESEGVLSCFSDERKNGRWDYFNAYEDGGAMQYTSIVGNSTTQQYASFTRQDIAANDTVSVTYSE